MVFRRIIVTYLLISERYGNGTGDEPNDPRDNIHGGL